MKFRLSNLATAAYSPFLAAKSSEHKGRKLRTAWAILIKVGVSGAALWYIHARITEGAAFIQWPALWDAALSAEFLFFFVLPAAALMVLNWGIEVVKWHGLVGPRYGIRRRTAVKAVLTGTTFGVFSSNRLGEFAGRILALQPKHRVGGSLLSFVNGAAQSLATFTFGALALLYLLESFGTESMGPVGSRILQAIVIFSWLMALTVFMRINALGNLLVNTSWLSRFKHHFEGMATVGRPELFRLYHLSLLRFVTFILQYLVVFHLLIPDPQWVQVMGASTLALFSTTILSFAPVPDLLLREAVAISYFRLFQFDALLVGEAVLMVWLINVALPAIIGAAVMFTYRIFRP